MPFTPFHFGPALFSFSTVYSFSPAYFIGGKRYSRCRAFLHYLFPYSEPASRFFHTYLGSSILAVLVALIIYPLRNWLNRITLVFRISQRSSFKKILFTSFLGVYFHVFLDSFLYPEMMPFYPLQGNPFVNLLNGYGSYSVIYGFCGITAILGMALYIYKIRKGVAVLD